VQIRLFIRYNDNYVHCGRFSGLVLATDRFRKSLDFQKARNEGEDSRISLCQPAEKAPCAVPVAEIIEGHDQFHRICHISLDCMNING
jgi:hypothetical protein